MGSTLEDLIAGLQKLRLLGSTTRFREDFDGSDIDWPRWYDEIADSLTDAERDAIWNLLDRLELYRVVEVEFL